MKIEYDRAACAGWFQCVQKWDEFKMDMVAGKAELLDSVEREEDVFVREVPTGAEEKARAAVNACPVDAIAILEE